MTLPTSSYCFKDVSEILLREKGNRSSKAMKAQTKHAGLTMNIQDVLNNGQLSTLLPKT